MLRAQLRASSNSFPLQAAVKAISWCPYARGILATGAGTNDRCIRLWDVRNPVADDRSLNEDDADSHRDLLCGKLLTAVDSGSQVRRETLLRDIVTHI